MKQNELVEESVRAAAEEPRRCQRKGDSCRRSTVVDAYLNYKLISACLQVKFGAFHRLRAFVAAVLEITSDDLFIWCPFVCALLGEMIFLIIVMWKHVAGDQMFGCSVRATLATDLIVWSLHNREWSFYFNAKNCQPCHLDRLARNLGAGAFVG